MSKKHQQDRVHSTNRVTTSISIDPEAPDQIQGQIGSLPSASEFVPSYEEVRRRAYQIHEEKGGGDLENWLEAERALKEEHHTEH